MSVEEFRKVIGEYSSALLLVDERDTSQSARISLKPGEKSGRTLSIKCSSLSRKLSGKALLLHIS